MNKHINREELAEHVDGRRIARRSLLKHGGALAGAAALFSTPQLASRGSAASSNLALDVACDGGTLVTNRAAGGDPDVPFQRGDTFIVQGRIYPDGTIEQGLTGPDQEGSIGQWICRGWYYYGFEEIANGAVPHVITTQLYLLDSFDGLVSEGTEGGIPVVRAVTGGYGAYRDVGGEVREIEVETNNTTLNVGGGVQVPAPNIRFEFQLHR